MQLNNTISRRMNGSDTEGSTIWLFCASQDSKQTEMIVSGVKPVANQQRESLKERKQFLMLEC